MAPLINFVFNTSRNYVEVQRNIFDPIQAQLSEGEYGETLNQRLPGAVNLSLFIRTPADVLLSHGVADKNYFWISGDDGQRLVETFRVILVPGRWLRRRLLRSDKLSIDKSRIFAVGWPRLDALRQMMADVRTHPPAARPTVLWAPTHDNVKRGEEQRSTSSYPDFEAYMPKLAQKYDTRVSLHPRNRDDKVPTTQKLVEADYVVSDFGTLVYEAWALGKPVIFPRWILGDRIQEYLPGSAEAHIFRHGIGYHPRSFDEMMDILAGNPVITEDVDRFMVKYLDNYRDGSSAAKIVKVLRRLAET